MGTGQFEVKDGVFIDDPPRMVTTLKILRKYPYFLLFSLVNSLNSKPGTQLRKIERDY
jgi:hypothetical protein